jgi:hypothetical protein
VNDWLWNIGNWIEHHPGSAAWVQALGATLAVATAVPVPALQARHARQPRDDDRRLRASGLARLPPMDDPVNSCPNLLSPLISL